MTGGRVRWACQEQRVGVTIPQPVWRPIGGTPAYYSVWGVEHNGFKAGLPHWPHLDAIGKLHNPVTYSVWGVWSFKAGIPHWPFLDAIGKLHNLVPPFGTTRY